MVFTFSSRPGLGVWPHNVGVATIMPAHVWEPVLEAALTAEDPAGEMYGADASIDVSAFGAMEAVREHGLRIPGDVSVVGFDDIPQAAHVHPPLTTVRQPLEEMGRTATRMLLERINDPQLPIERVELPTYLVLRQSCQPISRTE